MPQLTLLNAVNIGMKLDRAVLNKFGQVLLPAELELAERHIELLITWGVKSVWIGSSSDSSVNLHDEETQKKAKELLHKRLSWKPRNMWETELYTLALQTVIRLQLSQAKA